VRIGFDASVISPRTRYTGSGQYAEKLLRHLPGLASESEIIAYAQESVIRMIGPIPNLEWRLMPQLPLGRLSPVVSHLALFPGLVRRDRLDVMHVPAVHTRPSLPPVPRKLACPLVVTLHDVIPITFYEESEYPLPLRMRTYYRWNLRGLHNAACVITVSEAARQEILDTLKLDATRVLAIHNGIEFEPAPSADVTTELHLQPDTPYILYAGAYEPRKNLARWLDAFEQAVTEGIPHHLVAIVDKGSGHESAIQQQMSRLLCRDRLHFISGLDDATLRAVYSRAQIFGFPSLAEGFGFPPLQALSCGVPVIASDIPACREVLGSAVVYVNPYDVKAMASGIVRLARDESERLKLARAGPPQAAQFSWKETANRTMAVYESAARCGTPLIVERDS
jgi:glycosyltransferase involved in cell wall biosynthesis